MKHLAHAVIGAVIACTVTTAHADADYSVGFQLDRMPLLRTGTPGYDGPGLLDGQWDPYKRFDAGVGTREQYGTEVDPVTGEETPLYRGSYSGQRSRSSAGPHAFGAVYGSILGPNDQTNATGSAAVNPNSLSVTGQTRDLPATVRGEAWWERDFWLEAGTTITFAGLASMAASGDAAPMNPFTTVLGGDGHSFASLVRSDALNRARVEIGVTLDNLAAGMTGVLQHAVGADGFLSLTITNTGTERLFGNLRAGAWLDTGASIAAPVPEPATWLLLLGGAALVGGVARRRAPAQAPALA